MATNLLINNSVKTPSISFAAENGLLEIKGKSIPENSLEFYRPVFEWLESYSQAPAPSTVLRVALEYFNTSSSKCLLDLWRDLHCRRGKHGLLRTDVCRQIISLCAPCPVRNKPCAGLIRSARGGGHVTATCA